MTYKHYLMQTTGRDSLEHYIEYLRKHDNTYKRLSEKMRQPYIKSGFSLRFINQATA